MATCRACHHVLRRRLQTRIFDLRCQRQRGFTTASIRQRKQSHLPPQQSLYSIAAPPNDIQIRAAAHFFDAHQPQKSWVANEWRRDNEHHNRPRSSSSSSSPATVPSQFGSSRDNSPALVPEIAFLGRSNAGKSSLLNALLRDPSLCRVGPKPGKTVAMHAWSLVPQPEQAVRSASRKTNRPDRSVSLDNEPKLTVLDMPGYGHGSRTEWGQEIVTYLKRRKQLRRAMVMINPIHGIKEGDETMLSLLRAHGIVHQIVACKCDRVESPAKLQDMLIALRESVKASEIQQGTLRMCLDDVLAVGQLGDGKMNKDVEHKGMIGVGDVGWAVLRACGLDDYALDRYQRSIQVAGSKGSVPSVANTASNSVDTRTRAGPDRFTLGML